MGEAVWDVNTESQMESDRCLGYKWWKRQRKRGFSMMALILKFSASKLYQFCCLLNQEAVCYLLSIAA